MPDSLQESSEISPSSTLNSDKTQSPKLWQKAFWRLWYTNRWAAIAVLVGGCIGLLAVMFAIASIIEQNPFNSTPQPTQADSEPTIATTHDSSDNEYFAALPSTILYYSYAQTTNNKNMVQASPSDHENRVINIGFPDRYKFLISPNGQWLIRWNDHQIERSSASNPTEFSTIYSSTDQEAKITSLLWQNDSSTLAVATTTSTNTVTTDGQEEFESNIELIPQLTINPVAIYSQIQPHQLELYSFPSANQLFVVQKNGNQLSNLTEIDPQTETISSTVTKFNQNNTLASILFDQQLSYGYTHSLTEISQHTLDADPKTIYKLDTTCPNDLNNESHISSMSPSPSSKLLLISINLRHCRQHQDEASKKGQTLPQRQLVVYSISENKVIKTIDDPEITKFEKTWWSANELYVMADIGEDHVYTLDMNDFAISPIPNTNRQSLLKERIFPIGWLHPGT